MEFLLKCAVFARRPVFFQKKHSVSDKVNSFWSLCLLSKLVIPLAFIYRGVRSQATGMSSSTSSVTLNILNFRTSSVDFSAPSCISSQRVFSTAFSFTLSLLDEPGLMIRPLFLFKQNSAAFASKLRASQTELNVTSNLLILVTTRCSGL